MNTKNFNLFLLENFNLLSMRFLYRKSLFIIITIILLDYRDRYRDSTFTTIKKFQAASIKDFPIGVTSTFMNDVYQRRLISLPIIYASFIPFRKRVKW